MDFHWSFLCSIAVVVLFMPFGESIKCFQCSSVNNTECLNIGTNDTTSQYFKECNGNYQGKPPFCRKIVQRIIDAPWFYRVHRTCGWEPDHHHHHKGSCYRYENDFHKEIICSCHEDGCNSASKLGTWTSWIVFVTIVGMTKLIWD